MFDVELVREILGNILVAARRIERRFATISAPTDFLDSDDGVDRLDGIAMMLITIGENVKNLDKQVDASYLSQYPEVDWKGAKGLRDVLSHHYSGVDVRQIFRICRNDIPSLAITVEKMLKELAK